MANSVQTGGCLCGGVRFEVRGRSSWCAHCHCSLCRRAHGAPLVTWMGVRNDRFSLTAGEELLTDHASSEHATRRFCGRCGSPVVMISSHWPGQVHVVAAAVEGKGPRRKPSGHMFAPDRAAWFEIGDDLPHFGGDTGTEPAGRRALRQRVEGMDPRVRFAARWDRPELTRLMREAGQEEPDAAALNAYLDRHDSVRVGGSFVLVASGEDDVVQAFADVSVVATLGGSPEVHLSRLITGREADAGGLGDVLRGVVDRVALELKPERR